MRESAASFAAATAAAASRADWLIVEDSCEGEAVVEAALLACGTGGVPTCWHRGACGGVPRMLVPEPLVLTGKNAPEWFLDSD